MNASLLQGQIAYLPFPFVLFATLHQQQNIVDGLLDRQIRIADEDPRHRPFSLNALALIGTGLLLGALGSGLTLRRFLQV